MHATRSGASSYTAGLITVLTLPSRLQTLRSKVKTNLFVAWQNSRKKTPGFEIPVANALTEEQVRVEEITKEKMKIVYFGDKPRDLNIFIRGDAGRLGAGQGKGRRSDAHSPIRLRLDDSHGGHLLVTLEISFASEP